MNLSAIIKKIQNIINPPKEISNETILGFLRVLETLEAEEISCDELYERLDQYVEREVDKKDAALLMPLMREHLDTCTDCCEEYEALLHIIQQNEQK